MMCRRWLQISGLIVFLAGICAEPSPAEDVQTADRIDFARDIQPLLSDRCLHCHGPDAQQRQADLRFDIEEGAMADLGGYRAIVPGDVAASHLISRIISNDESERMPPADAARKLSQEEIDKFKQWIAEGAKWEAHWAFRPVQAAAVPAVKQQSWTRNPIDAFVLARLESEGFTPAPAVDRSRLLRRVSLDLTGLPPTLEQLDRFLDDSNPNAYERAVDRLLDSPRFAERVASIWLDAARYSDTYGYQVDRDRYVWPWRDWVVDALNENMPYDAFIQNQLAGDLVSDANASQILATTFNRLHPQKTEGGSVPEEFRTQYVADRVETVSTALLGLTMECCRCHDHKYDPITQKEYYQLFAFFNNIDEAGLYSYSTQSVPTPTLVLPTQTQREALAAAARRLSDAEREVAEAAQRAAADFEAWLATSDKNDPSGRVAYLDLEEPPSQSHVAVPGVVGRGIALSGDDVVPTVVGDFRRYDPFTISLALQSDQAHQRAVVFHRSLGWTDAGSRGYELLFEDGRLSVGLIHFWPGNAIRIRTRKKIPLHQWLHVTVVYDGSSRAAGLQLYLDGVRSDVEVVRDSLTKEIAGKDGDHLVFGARNRDSGFRHGQIDEIQVFDRQLSPLEIDALAGGDRLAVLRKTPQEQRTPSERQQLQRHYLLRHDRSFAQALSSLRDARAEQASANNALTEIMVMREMPTRRSTHLLDRGAYDQVGEKVERETPAAFPPFPQGAPRDRMGLVRWLTDPSHPLTARVAVNRFWQMIFGEGLVRTPEDFGTQGKVPTHPQLLDYLAEDFVRNGWDVKRLLRQLVTSATYRQSGVGASGLVEIDPENELLGRALRPQLPAEMLRDAALQAGGLLVDKRGGPPVKPYEVAVSFKPVDRDTGEGLYRRSLYTYWKRTGPAPAMMALDASKRDVCRVRRPRTQSPLQALVLLNDPQFVEAGRRLSQQMLLDGDPLVPTMFRTLVGRPPSAKERAALEQLYAEQRAYFQHHPEEAKLALQTGDATSNPQLPVADVAAGSVIANLLMNFEGFTREP